MEFDEGVADWLISVCGDAAGVLGSQAGARASISSVVLAEFRGVFADCYRENVSHERVARAGIIRVLEDVARQVRAAKARARVERRRLAEVAAWDAVVAGSHGVAGTLVDIGPRPSMVETPRPVVSVDAPRQGLRPWASGTVAGTSSADPDELESASTIYTIQDTTARAAVDRVTAAIGAFTGACSWVLTSLDDLTGAMRRYLADNTEDAIHLARIAAAFRATGGTGHAGAVVLSNTTLTLATAPTTLTGDALLAYLATATSTDLKALTKTNTWQHTLHTLTPEKVATWWAGMNPKGSEGFSKGQEGLLALAPAVFGALDGLPALARVRANQLNAAALLKASEKELAQQEKAWAIRQPRGDESRKKLLRQEIAYLKQVESGTVQLYLYDRDRSRIIEMIGTLNSDTRHVVTFVPGTYTSLQSFYKGDAQKVPNKIENLVSGTVAFVYKDGLFPGENDKTGEMDLTRIGEANDESRALSAGRGLAAFEETMRTDPHLGDDRDHTGIGWSWGLTNITSSEVAGIHYDKVQSLSGAGMPHDWEPDPTTQYTDLSYLDILQAAQTTGKVWDGNNPRTNPAFTHGDYYTSPNDDILSHPSPLTLPERLTTLMDNHTLIATDDPANKAALNDMAALVAK